MKKICVVTACRSEYGLLKWLLSDLKKSGSFKLQLIVTGAHLLNEQGHTIDDIIEDGFDVDYIVDTPLINTTTFDIAKSMGDMAKGFAEAFKVLEPDYILVLGDRYELLPICNTALIMQIPIIHLCGGDVTEGAIDDNVRNAVTMMSDYHFTGTDSAANNVKRMRGTDKNVWVVGEPGLDAFHHCKLLNREELSENLNLNANLKWILLTYHAETKMGIIENLETLDNILNSLFTLENYQILATYANMDFGGKEINEKLELYARQFPNKIKVVPSLGQLRYLSFMKEVEFVIGNSSSGIVEAPFLNIPVINVGNRQLGRYLCSNIIQTSNCKNDINNATRLIDEIKSANHTDLNYWGNGNCSSNIINILTKKIK